MPVDSNSLPIVAVGGLGGSGTRVIAEIMMRSGIYIGDDLNGACDNLIFTRLFKNPRFHSRATSDDFAGRMELFERYMTRSRLDLADTLAIARASITNSTHVSKPGFYARLVARHLGAPRQEPIRWGWKEPNAHIYLDALARNFPGLKYVHVVRHGLDMAFTKNVQQLRNWGHIFGIEVSGKRPIPYSQLNYWIASHERAIQLGEALLQKRFMLLNYDQFCRDPAEGISELLGFMEVKLGASTIEQLSELPKVSATVGRYRSKDLSIFTHAQFAAVQKHGFSVDTATRAA